MAIGGSTPLFTEDALSSFSEADYAVYNTVLRVGSLLAFMQVRDLAKEAHVSPASVVRFCKKGGYEGFSDFKRHFCDGLRSGELPAQVNEADVLEDFLGRVRGEEFQEGLSRAFNLLRWAKLTLFFGIGTSSNLAAIGARLFSNAGSFSLHLDDPFMPLVNVPAEGTVAVAVSYTGATPQTVSIAGDLVGSGCRLISVVNTDYCPLAKLSDVTIAYQVPSIPVSDRLNLATQTPVLYVFERLAHMLYEDSGGRVRDTRR